MADPITVGVIGATGKTGSSVVEGLLSSPTNFSVTSLTRATSVDNSINQQFAAKGVHIVGYDLDGPSSALVEILKPIDVFVPKVPSGRSDDAHMIYIDHRIVGDGNQKFGLIDLGDIGKYVAQIVSDPRTLNKPVFAHTDVLSMNEMWDIMAKASGETPVKEYISEAEINEVIKETRQRLDASSKPPTHSDNTMDIANYNMGQYRISWCIRGDNTPEYADYLGYVDFWNLFPEFRRDEISEDDKPKNIWQKIWNWIA
ncbi:hypothetical protein CDV36_010529 [Fusarium kuroshium]|uniref:NmrA-like domain-containing protein n=1 Tax=Fusarium kuroshium TaxID=2010991 RepID=A0A3M2RX10_9HYPO|nr:hypothetical protein CDV36_010529 [Fusarium kuroshium]